MIYYRASSLEPGPLKTLEVHVKQYSARSVVLRSQLASAGATQEQLDTVFSDGWLPKGGGSTRDGPTDAEIDAMVDDVDVCVQLMKAAHVKDELIEKARVDRALRKRIIVQILKSR